MFELISEFFILVVVAAFVVALLFRKNLGVAFGSMLMIGGALVIVWAIYLDANTHGMRGMENLVFGMMWIFGLGVIVTGLVIRFLSKRSERRAAAQKQNPPYQ